MIHNNKHCSLVVLHNATESTTDRVLLPQFRVQLYSMFCHNASLITAVQCRGICPSLICLLYRERSANMCFGVISVHRHNTDDFTHEVVNVRYINSISLNSFRDKAWEDFLTVKARCKRFFGIRMWYKRSTLVTLILKQNRQVSICDHTVAFWLPCSWLPYPVS